MQRSLEKDEISGMKIRRSLPDSTEENTKSPSPKHPRPVTVEKVKQIMQKEGRSARNLLSWSIPVNEKNRDFTKSKRRNKNNSESSAARDARRVPQKDYILSGDRKKIRSALSRRANDRKPVSFRARYWAYLFENLRRAVDEIYATCQSDSSVVECKEVLLILDNYNHEFQALIDWIQLEEKLENKDVHERPTSLSWEVRKSSPGRPRQKKNGSKGNSGLIPSGSGDMPTQLLHQQQRSKIYRCLNFGVPTSYSQQTFDIEQTTDKDDKFEGNNNQSQKPVSHQLPSKSTSLPSVTTWADLVKGVSTLPQQSTIVSRDEEEESAVEVDDFGVDEGGWEKVSSHRNRHGSRASNRRPNDQSQSSKSTVVKSLVFVDKEKVEEYQKQDEEQTSSLVKLEEREASLARSINAQHDANILVAEERERDLMRQIREVEEENSDVDETDCESARSSNGAKELTSVEKTPVKAVTGWSEFFSIIEAEQKNKVSVSWFDMMEDDEKVREPGSMVQMHEKLSSPFRKRNPAESKRKLEEKHRKAEERRQEMEKARAQRIKELMEKVQEVRSWKEDLIHSQRNFLKSSQLEKLERAKEQREMKLRKIVEKAQVEETKVNEIAFINSLQEKNKKHEVLMRINDHEDRLQELEQEKTRIIEMKSAKEENVKERLRAIEKDRQQKREDLMVKMKESNARVQQQRVEREKEREKAAKEKARDREMRLSALNAAHEEALNELQKKIQLKHDKSERRHQELLEIKKEKCIELSNLGRFSSTNQNPMIDSTPMVSKLEEDNRNILSSKLVEDEKLLQNGRTFAAVEVNEDLSNEEIQKIMKKRIKKIRKRMTNRSNEFLKQIENISIDNHKSSSNKKLVTLIKDLKKLITNQKIPWPLISVRNLDRLLKEVVCLLDAKSNAFHQNCFRNLEGFQLLEEVFKTPLPSRSLLQAVLVFQLACHNNTNNIFYAFYSNRLPPFIDLLLIKKTSTNLQESKKVSNEVMSDDVSSLVLKTFAFIMESLANENLLKVRQNKKDKIETIIDLIASTSSGDQKKLVEAYFNRGSDMISYIVASEVLERLNKQLQSVRNVDSPSSSKMTFIESALAFLASITSFVAKRNRLLNSSNCNKPNPDITDSTYLLYMLQHTKLMGIVSVLYGLLLHEAPERPTILKSEPDKPQKAIPSPALKVAVAVMQMLNATAEMDLKLVQQNLGYEGVSLEFRHICTYLLWYCSNDKQHSKLLNEVIICVGNFSLANKSNQEVVNCGVQPTILQQLTSLPFAYYSNPQLTNILFPTLIACCYENDFNFSTLEVEVSGNNLVTYLQSRLASFEKTSNKNGFKDSTSVRTSAENTFLTDTFMKNSIGYFSRGLCE